MPNGLPHIPVATDLARVNKDDTEKTIHHNARLSESYMLLLLCSSVICTLGLLLNSAPVVIGGMIISPLMWPLLNTGLGITAAREKTIFSSVFMVFCSAVLVAASAALITFFSPIKSLTPEIITRTEPTTLDLIVALLSGLVATVGVTHPRISTSLSGVAVATSLMPPLCVVGIGLAINNFQIFTGSGLLFLTNVVAIILTSVLTFFFTGFHPARSSATKKRLTFHSLVVIVLALSIISIPLISILRRQSFEVGTYTLVESTLKNQLAAIDPAITVENLRTSQDTSAETKRVLVTAEVWLPANVTIRYQDQEALQAALETAVAGDVNLKLRIQQSISLLSKQDEQLQATRKQLEELFVTQITQQFPTATIDSLSIRKQEDGWSLFSVLYGSPETRITQQDISLLTQYLKINSTQNVAVQLEFIPRISLLSEKAVLAEQIRSTVQIYFADSVISVEITDLSFDQAPNTTIPTEVTLNLRIHATTQQRITAVDISQLEQIIEEEYQLTPSIEAELISVSTL